MNNYSSRTKEEERNLSSKTASSGNASFDSEKILREVMEKIRAGRHEEVFIVCSGLSNIGMSNLQSHIFIPEENKR